jgi:hypothetical protein
MPRKAEGATPLTAAERQARQRARRASQADTWRQALERITQAHTVREARDIASAAIMALRVKAR